MHCRTRQEWEFFSFLALAGRWWCTGGGGISCTKCSWRTVQKVYSTECTRAVVFIPSILVVGFMGGYSRDRVPLLALLALLVLYSLPLMLQSQMLAFPHWAVRCYLATNMQHPPPLAGSIITCYFSPVDRILSPFYIIFYIVGISKCGKVLFYYSSPLLYTTLYSRVASLSLYPSL